MIGFGQEATIRAISLAFLKPASSRLFKIISLLVV
jgi:hypothetical protein